MLKRTLTPTEIIILMEITAYNYIIASHYRRSGYPEKAEYLWGPWDGALKGLFVEKLVESVPPPEVKNMMCSQAEDVLPGQVCYRLTERGKVLVSYFLETPVPTAMTTWKVERKDG